jgi:putative ABC transport system permease protein
MKSHASFWEAVNVAAGSLRSSKLRTFLTLLGVILATTTLIAVMSVIEGMNQYIAKEVSDMGSEGFRIRRIVMLGEFDAKKYLTMEKRNPQMNREEYEFIKERATNIREIGMEAFRGVKVSLGGQDLEQVQMSGVTANMAVIQSLKVVNGRFISAGDEARRAMVAFIGNDIVEKFFPGRDPLGKTIMVDGRPMEIVGVAKTLGTVFGQSRDKFVMIPAETYFKMYSSRRGLGYNALAIDQAHLEQAKDEVRALLRAWRHLRPGQEDSFGIVASDSLVNMWDKLTGTIAATAVGVVSVFMVVGGVVIMNIMLAAVTERTHEIGIRKSIGARHSDILKQFLVESAMMAGLGGLVGVLLAWIVAVLVRSFTPVPMQVPLTSIVVGVGLSSAVGLFFGIFPAQRAARMDPIEALRYEK